MVGQPVGQLVGLSVADNEEHATFGDRPCLKSQPSFRKNRNEQCAAVGESFAFKLCLIPILDPGLDTNFSHQRPHSNFTSQMSISNYCLFLKIHYITLLTLQILQYIHSIDHLTITSPSTMALYQMEA